jgi:NAD kinase
MQPRCVLVQRATEYEELLARHGTHEQVRFFLHGRGRTLEEVAARHERLAAARRDVLGAVPPDWRRAIVARPELDRFLFANDDVVVVLGQDGLVANAAKYLSGQPVIGLNPEPERWPGVLVPHPPGAAADLLRDVTRGRATTRPRTMVEATLDDGRRLLALNEVFLGHASHQSARYALEVGDERERQSSSGVIVTTGTGATGWAASIHRERRSVLRLPAPEDPALAYFVREAWPSAATGTALTEGRIGRGEVVRLQSEMGAGGVAFGDGIEGDRLPLDWGRRVEVGVARKVLNLVQASTK